MKKYSFHLTKQETMEFCIRALWEQQRLRPAPWLLMLLICILECIWSLRIGLLIVVFWLLLLAVIIGRNYALFKKNLCEKGRTIWVENGMLKQEAELYGEIPCANIREIRVTPHLLMLGYYQAKKQPAWYSMPLRVFADRQEREAFVASIQNPGGQRETAASSADGRREATAFGDDGRSESAAAGMSEASDADFAGQEALRLTFWVDEERWVRTLVDVTELVRAGTLPELQRKKTAFIIIGVAVVASFAAALLVFHDMGRACLMVGFLVALVCLFLYRGMKEHPEKKIRRQLHRGLIQSDVCGEWHIILEQEAVRQERPGESRVIMPVRELLCLVETQGGFFFFQKDKRHFIPIPKEGLKNDGQEETLRQWCVQRQIPVLQGKSMRYLPGWLFYALLVLLIAGYLAANAALAVWDARREARAWIAEDYAVDRGWPEEFDPADYPDYVPLDRQVEVLSSLGFTVLPETVAAARESLDAGLGVWVEGYPYTWLLSQLGAPSYDENWQIAGYSDEVFWFDFEGWDISNDYIDVLYGMLALAPGSVLDDVKNIRENTDAVDWEAGSGTIEVLLDWRGQTCVWRMEMYDDWIDEAVLGIFNSLLGQAGEEERFYVTGDNGQGALVFYGTPAWAAGFEGATGIALDAYAGGTASGNPAIVMTANVTVQPGLNCYCIRPWKSLRDGANACYRHEFSRSAR